MNFANITAWTIPEGSVTQVTDSNGDIIWKLTQPVTSSYFYVEDTSGEANTLNIKKSSSSAPTVTIYYSSDQQNWTSLGSTSTTDISTTIPANSKLYLKATVNNWGSSTYYNGIKCSGSHNVGGNILSLLYGDNYAGQTGFPSGSARNFYGLFNGNNTLVSAGNLELPSTTSSYCYTNMFNGCSALTTTPVLPSTTIASNCYQGMFSGCRALTTAPVLPATSLNDTCYANMFFNCTSLTTAPVLPATTLGVECYKRMFQGCTALTTAPALNATTLADYCYQNMFYNCTALTTAPASLPATTLTPYCYDYMFYNCSSLETAPALAATTMANRSCEFMFCGCSSLINIQASLPATTMVQNCYQGMFKNCSSLTTAPELPATTLANYCYTEMFNGCSSLMVAPVLAATTLANYCYQQMFYGCTTLTSAPELPATTLVDSCYQGMFYNCSNLNEIIIYADDNSASSCTWQWVTNVAQQGDFYNLGQASYSIDSVHGVPIGWTLHTTPPTPPAPPTPTPTSKNDYFYVEDASGEGCTFTIKKNYNYNDRSGTNPAHNPPITMYYSTDQENWHKLTDNISASGHSRAVPAGGKLYLRAIAEFYSGYDGDCHRDIHTYINCDKKFNVGGNIMSLLLGSNFKTGIITTGYYTNALSYLFSGTRVADASNLYLADANGGLSYGCFDRTFQGCRSLITAPATLPATNLAGYDYTYMFYNCTNLTTAPVIEATTLSHDCCSNMFNGCSSLNRITTYMNDISATDCLYNWMSGVSAQGDFYNLGGAQFQSGVSGIPSGWTEHNN